MVIGIRHFLAHFRSNLLSFNTISNFKIIPLDISTMTPPSFFLTKIKAIPIQLSFINYS